MLKVALALSGVAAVAVLSGPASEAHADWSASIVGSGQARARTLAPPIGVTATCAGLATVQLTWNATEAPPYVDSYQVSRSVDSGSWTDVGGAVPAPGSATYSVIDSGLLSGTYVYRVTAAKVAWRAVSAVSEPRTITIVLCS